MAGLTPTSLLTYSAKHMLAYKTLKRGFNQWFVWHTPVSRLGFCLPAMENQPYFDFRRVAAGRLLDSQSSSDRDPARPVPLSLSPKSRNPALRMAYPGGRPPGPEPGF